jgi:hypothetical protein
MSRIRTLVTQTGTRNWFTRIVVAGLGLAAIGALAVHLSSGVMAEHATESASSAPTRPTQTRERLSRETEITEVSRSVEIAENRIALSAQPINPREPIPVGSNWVCPDGASYESEPCGQNTNGGCLSNPPAFEQISCGESICGTVWSDDLIGDTDWYEFTLTQTARITICVTAELPVRFGPVLNIISGDCNSPGAGFHGPSGLTSPGEELCVSKTFAPGRWWIFLGTAVTNYSCGGGNNNYSLTLTCESCDGDLNGDDIVNVSDLLELLAAWGPCADITQCRGDLDGNGHVNVSDLLILLSNWGTCEITTPLTCGAEEANNCCQPSGDGSPFCNDNDCCYAVCAADAWCCSGEWDATCALLATTVFCSDHCDEISGCGLEDAGGCCRTSATPFCDESECCQTVCAQDPWCCTINWDLGCVYQAEDLCSTCTCCKVQDGLGCGEPTCEALVCSVYPHCCETGWDYQCAALAMLECDQCPMPSCGNPNSTASDCCDTGSTGVPSGGCTDPECCATLCALDPWCCYGTFYSGCAQLAMDHCEFCEGYEPPQPICSYPEHGTCCYPSEGPGCNNINCCAVVCPILPHCCEEEWDMECALVAMMLCATCEGACPFKDLPPNNDCQDADWAELSPGDSHTFIGNNTCATTDCPTYDYGEGHVWISFTLTEASTVHISFCGTDPGWSEFWPSVEKACPCGDSTHQNSTSWDMGCPNGNGQLWFVNLPAGTYWYPILLREAAGANGDYIITISATPHTPPPPRE